MIPKFLISISATNPTYILHTMPENIQERMHALIAQHGSVWQLGDPSATTKNSIE